MYIMDKETIIYLRKHAIFTGGESSIYKKGNLLYKIFDNPDIDSKNREERLIPLMKKEALKDIGQIPIDVIRNEEGKIIGAVLPYIEGKKVKKYINITNDLTKILEISRILERFHKENVALIDLSLDNFIINQKGKITAIDLTSAYVDGYASHICSALLLKHYKEEVYVEDTYYLANYLDKVSLYLIYLNYITNKTFHQYNENVYYRMLNRYELNPILRNIYEQIKEPLLYATDIPYPHEILKEEMMERKIPNSKVYALKKSQ